MPTTDRSHHALLARLTLAAWATHVLVMWRVHDGSAYELLWACHLAPLALAFGVWRASAPITSVAAIVTALGSTIWVANLVALERLPEPTPALVHLGVLALALVAVRVVGWDPRAWWRVPLVLLVLAAITRAVPGAARFDVNLAFRVWPGLEPVFPSYPAFAAFVLACVTLASFVIGRALARLAERSEDIAERAEITRSRTPA